MPTYQVTCENFHISQFTKHISSMTLASDTLLHIKKLWDAIISDFCWYVSAKNSWTSYKYLRAEHHNISYFLLPPDTHPNFPTAKENYEALSRALRIRLVKYDTITSSKAPKSHAKPVTFINNYNEFDLLIYVVFSIINQLGGLGHKAQDIGISFHLGEL